MPLVLNPTTDPATGGPLTIGLTGITPDRLAGLSLDAVKRLAVTADERPAELGELFSISGDAADSVLECRGDFSRVHFVGAGMAAGTIRVTGSVGRHAAESMTGGRLEVAGDAGDWLAAEMSGGEVVIGGSAGDNLAGALPGSDHGLRGGVVVVLGDVGCLTGQRMRRGIVAVGGNCGAAPAFEMRAGTVVVAGRVGAQPGLGMRRGSLVALADQPAIPATFHRGRAWLPPFIGLQLTELRPPVKVVRRENDEAALRQPRREGPVGREITAGRILVPEVRRQTLQAVLRDDHRPLLPGPQPARQQQVTPGERGVPALQDDLVNGPSRPLRQRPSPDAARRPGLRPHADDLRVKVLAERGHLRTPACGLPRLHPPPQEIVPRPLGRQDLRLRVGRVRRVLPNDKVPLARVVEVEPLAQLADESTVVVAIDPPEGAR